MIFRLAKDNVGKSLLFFASFRMKSSSFGFQFVPPELNKSPDDPQTPFERERLYVVY